LILKEPETLSKNLYIKTYGCQMNVYDSDRMVDVMRPFGYAISDDLQSADLILINTCHIREKATDKLYSELGRIRELKKRRAERDEVVLVGVTGCVSQAEGGEIQNRMPFVDIVVGPQSYHMLPELVTKALRKGGESIELDFNPEEKFDKLIPHEVTGNTALEPSNAKLSEFLTVQEGCDKFCTFCVVPYTRGAEYSRPPEQIIREAIGYVNRGTREIYLLGQNVNAYHGVDGRGKVWSLARMIEKLAEIKGLERIRYTTSHPRDMQDDLIEAHRDIPKLMPYLHLPIQSGSDNILKQMNRKHTAAEYLKLLDKIRAARPDIAFSSDFIVGFPGESEQDFADTLRIVSEVGYASSYSFKYSPRPGTPAAVMGQQVEDEIASERLERLQSALSEQHLKFNHSFMGKELDVMIDFSAQKPASLRKGQLSGKSPWLQTVNVNLAPSLLGGGLGRGLTTTPQSSEQFIKVRINETNDFSLVGEVVCSYV
jgi:tRNA-2-methylthio-N6-dimethylallyladenosine synthase